MLNDQLHNIPRQTILDLIDTPTYINVKSLIENCAIMDIIRITVKTVGPTMSTYGPGAFLRIMLALLESTQQGAETQDANVE